jgi:hypothetical protein
MAGTEETPDSTRPRTPVRDSSKALRSAARSTGGEGDARTHDTAPLRFALGAEEHKS